MYDPIALLFGGMTKLGPGSDADTVHMLGLLPKKSFATLVDAGCGTGRQTLALAQALQTPIHALDTHAPFLDTLQQCAEGLGLEALVHTHEMDMGEIPQVFTDIDLLWSEGAAYNIGFVHALRTWRTAMAPDGWVVVSELCWLDPPAPEPVRAFFAAGYPDMKTVAENVALAEAAGYTVHATHVLPQSAWIEGYYEVLEPRARALADHPDETVRAFAEETLEEINIFAQSGGSYGYVFYMLKCS